MRHHSASMLMDWGLREWGLILGSRDGPPLQRLMAACSATAWEGRVVWDATFFQLGQSFFGWYRAQFLLFLAGFAKENFNRTHAFWGSTSLAEVKHHVDLSDLGHLARPGVGCSAAGAGCLFGLGPPARGPFTDSFWGEGSPTKIDILKKAGTLILTSQIWRT